MMGAPGHPSAGGRPAQRWRGLTTQLFFFTVLPLTVLLLVIAFGSQALHHQAMRSLVGDRDLRAVRAAASSLDQSVRQRTNLLALLAGAAAGGSQPPGAEFLDQAAARYGFDGGLVLVDAQGRPLAQSSTADPSLTASGNAGAQLARGADGQWLQLAAAPSGENRWLAGAFRPATLASEALAGLTTGEASVLLVGPGGELLYLFGHLHVGEEIPLVERSGVAEVLRTESGVNYIPARGPGHDLHGGEHVIAFAPVGETGWGLVLEEPWEGTASPLLRASQSAPLILAPVLVLALIALWFGARQIVQPLQALERRAGRLADGDFAAIQPPVGGIGEIRSLQDRLVEMTAALAAAQTALHGYIGALTAGVENERRALARELHDDTLQALIALNQHVQLALLQAQDDAQRQPLLDLQARVAQTIASLRGAIGGLRPIYLDDLGLAAALGMLARETAQASGLAVRFEQQGEERRLPPEVELAFYRITQEALNNSARHSGAGSAVVRLEFDADSTRLTIHDDGRGFRVPAAPNAFARLGHYGLLGMRERADLAGAALEIDSAPGQGTRVTARYAPSPELTKKG